MKKKLICLVLIQTLITIAQGVSIPEGYLPDLDFKIQLDSIVIENAGKILTLPSVIIPDAQLSVKVDICSKIYKNCAKVANIGMISSAKIYQLNKKTSLTGSMIDSLSQINTSRISLKFTELVAANNIESLIGFKSKIRDNIDLAGLYLQFGLVFSSENGLKEQSFSNKTVLNLWDFDLNISKSIDIVSQFTGTKTKISLMATPSSLLNDLQTALAPPGLIMDPILLLNLSRCLPGYEYSQEIQFEPLKLNDLIRLITIYYFDENSPLFMKSKFANLDPTSFQDFRVYSTYFKSVLEYVGSDDKNIQDHFIRSYLRKRGLKLQEIEWKNRALAKRRSKENDETIQSSQHSSSQLSYEEEYYKSRMRDEKAAGIGRAIMAGMLGLDALSRSVMKNVR